VGETVSKDAPEELSNGVNDGKIRRRIERDYSWNGSAWTQTNEIHFVYDSNLVIQERDINNQPQVTYTRGQDLSGSLQGAGGIGGLLARSDRNQVVQGLLASGGVSEFGTPSYFHADGNGNVTMLIAASQMIVAKYLYDPFGNTLAKCGLLADVNNYRFSSKEWNGNSGLYYYLYRFYDPNLQRWVNRDPIGEDGGLNLYEMVDESPIDNFDELGYGPPGCKEEQAALDQARDKYKDDVRDAKNTCAHANNDMTGTGIAIGVGLGGIWVAGYGGENPVVGAGGIIVAGGGLAGGVYGLCVCAQDGAELTQAKQKIDNDKKAINAANQALKDCQAKAKKPSPPHPKPHPKPHSRPVT
jgi:RHS repeat-associated protein